MILKIDDLKISFAYFMVHRLRINKYLNVTTHTHTIETNAQTQQTSYLLSVMSGARTFLD